MISRVMNKLATQVTAGHLLWQKRQLIITKNALLFARPGVDMTIDCVPLLAVKHVKCIQNKDDVHGESCMIIITLRNPDTENGVSYEGSGEEQSDTARFEGKVFTLKAKVQKEGQAFASVLEKACADLLKRNNEGMSIREKLNEVFRRVHKSPRTQFGIFALIGLNFVINCLNFELLPEPDTPAQRVFDYIDMVFTGM